MKAYEVLEQFGWCQGSAAIDNNGQEVGVLSNDAIRFCTIGAVAKAYIPTDNARDELSLKMQGRIRDALGLYSISNWNDAPERTEEEVIALLKRLDI